MWVGNSAERGRQGLQEANGHGCAAAGLHHLARHHSASVSRPHPLTSVDQYSRHRVPAAAHPHAHVVRRCRLAAGKHALQRGSRGSTRRDGELSAAARAGQACPCQPRSPRPLSPALCLDPASLPCAPLHARSPQQCHAPVQPSARSRGPRACPHSPPQGSSHRPGMAGLLMGMRGVIDRQE